MQNDPLRAEGESSAAVAEGGGGLHAFGSTSIYIPSASWGPASSPHHLNLSPHRLKALFPGQVPLASYPLRQPVASQAKPWAVPIGSSLLALQQTSGLKAFQLLCFLGATAFKSAAACLGLNSVSQMGPPGSWMILTQAYNRYGRATRSPSITLWNNCYFLIKFIFRLS